MITELKPLTTFPFDSTSASDINNADQTVGKSWFTSRPYPPSAPLSQATLWDVAGTPTPLAEGPNRSEALRINDAGNVLFQVSDDPTGDYSYRAYVGPVGAAVALDTLIAGEPGASAVDLNDNDLLLGVHVNTAGVAENFLYDLGTGGLTVLPLLNHRLPRLVGVDNAGRVLATITGPPTGSPAEYPQVLYWLPPGAGQWQPTGIQTYHFISRLSRTGLVLASISRINPAANPYNDQFAGYLDLDAPAPLAFKEIPSLLPPGNTSLYASWAADANAAGTMVGQVFYPGRYPLRFDIATGQAVDLRPHFPPNWHADRAIGINDNGFIVGAGSVNIYTPMVRSRAWLINPDRDTHASELGERLSESVRILIGIIGGGSGYVLPVNGPPRPIVPDGLHLLDGLSPGRREVLIGLLLGSLAGTLEDRELSGELAGIERRLLEKALAHLDGSHRD